jgi:hypothetical protein
VILARIGQTPACDMRRAALDYLGVSPSKPEVEFEVSLPKAAVNRLAEADTCAPGAAWFEIVSRTRCGM